MKKKIYIIGLIISFLFSTTGFSITQHFCRMMEKNSLSECESCRLEEEESNSCCTEGVLNVIVQITANESNCCVESYTYKKIEDDFSPSVNLKFITGNVVLLTIDPISLNVEIEKINLRLANYNLPPPKFGKQLLQTIHQLKIDLPIC